LKFDHFGPGNPWEENEVPFRIWFKMVNNCKVPIQIRTFGGPDGALGVMDRVVKDEDFLKMIPEPVIVMPEPPLVGTLQVDRSLEAQLRAKEVVAQPWGYESEVSSTMLIPSEKAVLFSLPANHLSEKWHFEIPFTFKLPSGHTSRPEDVGGEPQMQLRYHLWDLPDAVQVQVKKLFQPK
jgi:hypothetical protein